MFDANEELSKRLHDVLDVIGASEYNRKNYWESAMVLGITQTFIYMTYSTHLKTTSYYQVGSQCEGTTTPALQSDLDVIWCDGEFPVEDNLFETKQRGISYLMLTDEDTKPGYVRLQCAEDKCRITAEMGSILEGRTFFDRKGRICVENYTDYFGPNTYRNGPADTIPRDDGRIQVDQVYALKCRQIPRSANSWIHRTRKYDWPSQKQLKVMGSYGCFVVGVAHPHNNNKSSEWRISFTLQERDLMSSLNETQHKCYILLKMIKKNLIEPKAGESISSYHCKTSLFYTIENSHPHCWTNAKLILCVQQCLKRLFIWVKARNCPNYFIPEENMFDKLSITTLDKIEYVLNDIFKRDIEFLYSLTCDNVGELLKSKLRGDELVYSLVNMKSLFVPNYWILLCITGIICDSRNALVHCVDTHTHTGYMNGLMQLLLYLQNTNHVAEHTTRDVRLALDSIIPHIQLQYKQCTYAQYLSQGNLPDLRTTNMIPKNIECDLISSKLSLASKYIQCEQYQEECKRILVSCEQELEPFVISVCNCNNLHCNTAPNKKLCFTDMSSKEFRQCTTGCMVFHPSQACLVPGALQYELFRHVYTQPVSEYNSRPDRLLNRITVDSQIYLYFLQYVLYSNERNQLEIETAIVKLRNVLIRDQSLGHRETALNLLGWIFLQRNEIPMAWSYFCLSWRVRPFKNAAKWHMLILLSIIRSRTKG